MIFLCRIYSNQGQLRRRLLLQKQIANKNSITCTRPGGNAIPSFRFDIINTAIAFVAQAASSAVLLHFFLVFFVNSQMPFI